MKYETKNSPLCLDYYKGFDIEWQRVCRVKSRGFEWYYEEIDRSVMFDDHRSWIYVITVDGIIFKIGETGNPLGIEAQCYTWDRFKESQPQSNTKSRLGRYRKGGESDETVRFKLKEETSNNDTLVEIWAYKCPEFRHDMTIHGISLCATSQIHKSLEKKLIDAYIELNGDYPPGNCGRY